MMEFAAGNDCPRWSMPAHQGRITRVDERPVLNIGNEYLYVDQIRQGAVGGLENRLHIGHGLIELGLDAFGKSARSRAERQLAGYEQQVSGDHAVGVMTARCG